MNEPARKRSSVLATTVFIVAVLAIVYPLSVGPASWFYDHDLMPEPVGDALELFYWPISWVYQETDFFETNPVGRVYWAYIEWWQE